MNSLTTLGKVCEKVNQLSRNCVDRMVLVKAISFNDFSSVNIDGERFPLRNHAQQGFSYRLGIPHQYLKKCPSEVQAYNLNHWIQKEKNEELFLRFDGNEVRAVFTPRYKPVDNFEVLERLDSLGYDQSTSVQCRVDQDFMVLNIPDGSQTFQVKGERLTPGISISNSEVGIASLSLSAFILRLVCTNGLITKTSISASFKHVSLKIIGRFPEVLAQVSRDVLNTRDQIHISLESKVDNPISAMERFNKEFGVSHLEKEAVEWGWAAEAGNTMFHIINTYTRAAQYEVLSADSSYKLQKVGGTILAMIK